MQRLCTTFAIRYNLHSNRVGHLFQGHFKSQEVLGHFAKTAEEQKNQYSLYLQQELAASRKEICNAVFDTMVEQSSSAMNHL